MLKTLELWPLSTSATAKLLLRLLASFRAKQRSFVIRATATSELET